jgi:hypothetical protein
MPEDSYLYIRRRNKIKSHHLCLIPYSGSDFSLRHYGAAATPTSAVFIIPVSLGKATHPSNNPKRLRGHYEVPQQAYSLAGKCFLFIGLLTDYL